MGQIETFIIKLQDMFSGPLKKADAQIDHTREKFMGIKEMLEGGIAAYGIYEFGKSSVMAFNEMAQANAQVRASLQSTGNVAKKSFQGLNDEADKLENNSLFKSDDILRRVTANMLTFTSVTGNTFEEAQQDVLDLSAKLGEDLQGATIQVGKALNDPIRGMVALHRVGVAFSQQQKKQIQFFQETNQIGKAQAIILKELKTEFGGSAKAAAEAGTGGWTQLMNSFFHTKEVIGEFITSTTSGLLPVLRKVNISIREGAQWLIEHRKGVMVVVGALTGLAFGIGAVIVVTKAWALVQTVINILLTANPIGLIVVAIGVLVGAVYEAWQNFAGFRGAIKGVWAVLENLGHNIKEKFTQIPKMIIAAFKEIPKNFISIFSGIGKIIGALVTGNFKAIPGLMKDVGESMLKSNPLTAIPAKMVSEFAAGSTDVFKKTYGDEIDAQRQIDANEAKRKKEKEANERLNGGVPGGSGIGAGISEIRSGAPKTFNINIQRFTGVERIETTNMTEATSEVGASLLEEMTKVLNNLQVME